MTAGKSLKYQDFNALLVEAVDETIRALLGRQVLKTLYQVLLERHDVTRDELVYRLETVYKILKDIFGIAGGGVISRAIARRLYEKLGLKFDEVPHLGLADYIEIAKHKLAQESHSEQSIECATQQTT